MQRVTGLGGVFFKARDPKALRDWYRRHLGVDVQDWGGAVFAQPPGDSYAVWCVFDADDSKFAASPAPFVVNYRVADCWLLLDALRAEGCAVDDKTEDSEYGRFGWVTDPEGNRIELWQAPAGAPT